MPVLAIYDSMVMLQWAAQPPDAQRQHATVTALVTGAVRLAMSRALLDEILGVLSRPELAQKLPSLTPQRAAAIAQKTLEYSEWFENIPHTFSLVDHPKDDHLFNLAIESKARYLVTWERRILNLAADPGPDATKFRQLAPGLTIMNPPDFSSEQSGSTNDRGRH